MMVGTMPNIYKKKEKPKIQKPVYIQSNTRKSYPNRFLIELINRVDEYKSPTESRRHFIEDAIIEKLQRCGCEFNKPMSNEDKEFWLKDVENL